MSHFSSRKSTHVSKSLKSRDTSRTPRERRRENKKQEDLPEEQHSPRGQTLQEDGAQSPENRAKETEDNAAEEGPSPSKVEPQKDAKDQKLPTPLGPVQPPSASSGLGTTKAKGCSWELSPPTAKSFPVHDVQVVHWPQQGPFWQFMDMKVEKRLAGRKERRSRFGEVNTHRRFQSGQVFSPFQALATMEMRRLVFPRDVPMSSDTQRARASSLNDISLQDSPLSSTELGLGKEDNPREREKPVSHMKTLLFPPIVKTTKYNDMK